MLAIFSFFLALSIFLFGWDLFKKTKSSSSSAESRIEEFQYSCNVILNLIIAVSLLVFVRYFFEMVRKHFKNHIRFDHLKCALSTLCATFFLRSVLMLVLIFEIRLFSKNQDTFETTLVDLICVTMFLVFGEILPIAVIFNQHYESLKNLPDEEQRPTVVMEHIEAMPTDNDNSVSENMIRVTQMTGESDSTLNGSESSFK